jgi:hypothetical protein
MSCFVTCLNKGKILTATEYQPPDDVALRKLIADIIRKSPKKRQQIAEELSIRVGRRITVHMLNTYTSDSHKTSHFPAAWLPAFSEIMGDDRLERYVLSNRNREVLEFGEIAVNVLNEATQQGLKSLRKKKGK